MAAAVFPGSGRNAASREGSSNTGAQQRQSITSERIYSARQMTEALRSALTAVKEQLSVLAILDGTAVQWPGVSQALDDLAFMVDMSMQATTKLESQASAAASQAADSAAEARTLKDTLASSNNAKQEALSEAEQLRRDLKSEKNRTEQLSRDLERSKEQGWELERQRAELATEMDKSKQDLEFLEGEVSSLRTQSSEQASTISDLREELAGKRADVQHLKSLTNELKSSRDHLKGQLESTQSTLRDIQAALSSCKQDRTHFEKEGERLAEEAGRLSSELHKSTTEVARLKEWQDVLKKVQDDKLREEQAKNAASKSELEAQLASIERQLASSQAGCSQRDERLRAREAEVDGARKQVALLQLQLREASKGTEMLQKEKAVALKALEDARAQVAKLQQQVHALTLADKEKEKMVAMASGSVREMAAAERLALQSKVDEALKEAAVQKTLADGCVRDIRELQAKLNAESARAARLQAALDHAGKASMGAQYEALKHDLTSQAASQAMRNALDAKDAELRKVRYEAESRAKQAEKNIERLQREVDASANEILRLRAALGATPPSTQAAMHAGGGMVPGEYAGTLLPPLAKGPATLHDDLAALRRILGGGGGGGGGMGHASPGHVAWATNPNSTMHSPHAHASPQAMPPGIPGPNHMQAAQQRKLRHQTR